MRRLADRFVGGEWHFPLGIEETKPFVIDAARAVGAGPLLLAENVAEYVDQTGETELRDYPSLAPAWPSFWVEYPSSSGKQRRGVWVVDITDVDIPLTRSLAKEVEPAHPEAPFVAGETDPDDVRWLVSFVPFLETERGVWGPIGNVILNLDESGVVIGQTWSLSLLMDWITAARQVKDERLDLEDDPQDAIPTVDEIKALTAEKRTEVLARLARRRGAIDRDLEKMDARIDALGDLIAVGAEIAQEEIFADNGRSIEWLNRALAPAYQAVAFLHCRNVEIDIHHAPAKVQAKRARRRKRSLLRYHTLRLVVPRKQSEGADGAETHRKALHIVAGHFAHYGACCSNHEPHGLLFGRLEGVYWHPSHVRGNAARGTVRTDFDLVVPA